MARFVLHKTFPYPKDSELVASADRLSECIRAWEDDPEAAFGYVVLNTEVDEIVWRPENVAVFPAAHLVSINDAAAGGVRGGRVMSRMTNGERAAARMLAGGRLSEHRYFMVVDALYDRSPERCVYVFGVAERLRRFWQRRGQPLGDGLPWSIDIGAYEYRS